MSPTEFNGYPIETIDDIAKDILQLLVEEGVQPDLALLSLCRSITIIGSPTDLDLACKIIDDLSQLPADGTLIAAEVWEDDKDDWAV